MTQRLIVVGAGGQARDTRWLIQEIDRARAQPMQCVGFVVTDLARSSERDSEVLGDYRWLRDNIDAFDGFALGIGAPEARLAVARELVESFPGKSWPALIHPRVELDRASSRIGRGAMIGAGCVGSVNLELGDFALVNLGVTLGHEARIATGCVINHNASIAGGVSLEEAVLVGSSAAVLQYLTVGKAARIGAGAVVTRDVPAGETWVGVPARRLV